MNFVKFLKTPFFQNTSGRLFLRDRKEKHRFLRKQGNSTKERHIIPGKYVNLYQNTVSSFARLLGVCASDYNPGHVNILTARRQNFNRAPNFVKVPRLCTIQNASNSRQKYTSEHLFYRTAFSGFCQISVTF